MPKFLITIAAATVAGWLLKKIKFPAGMLVGAIVGSIALNLTSDLAYMPYAGKLAAQIIAGAFIGCGLSRERLKSLPKIAGPFLCVMAELVLANAIAGALIWKTSKLDFVTAMLSTMPGGMTDTPLIAADMGADIGYVAVLQFVRLIFSVAIMPTLIVLLDGGRAKMDRPEGAAPKAEKGRHTPREAFSLLAFAAASFAGGWLGKISGISAGALAGAMFAAMLIKLAMPGIVLPPAVKRIAQVLAGAFIGCAIQREQLASLNRFILLPAAIIIAVYATLSVLTGILIQRFFHRGRREAMLFATPGGASDMALTAADIGVFSTDLVFMQILRMIIVLSVFPQAILLIGRLLGAME